MTLSVTHQKVSAIADDPAADAAGEVLPSDWNANHTITGTKADFDAACSDGNFLYVGDVTQYTDENAQDAIGAMIDTTLNYVDGTPLLQRAAITGDIAISAGSNSAAISAGVIVDADISASAAIDASKIGGGAVSNTEFSYLDGVTSAIQTQIDSKAAKGANTDITSVLLNQTGLVVKGATSNALTIKPNETLSAGRTLSIVTNDANRSLTVSGDATISGLNTGDQDLSSYVTGPASATSNGLASYNGTTGKIIKDSGVTASSGALTATSLIANGASPISHIDNLRQGGLTMFDGANTNWLQFSVPDTLSSNHIVKVDHGGADRTLTFSGDATISGLNTGDQTITLTGDASGSGTGSITVTIVNKEAVLYNSMFGAF